VIFQSIAVYMKSAEHYSSNPLTMYSSTNHHIQIAQIITPQIFISSLPTRPNPHKTHPEPWNFHKQWISGKLLSG